MESRGNGGRNAAVVRHLVRLNEGLHCQSDHEWTHVRGGLGHEPLIEMPECLIDESI
jgi:hypothetical protein